jgi:prephenate dehydrogenase
MFTRVAIVGVGLIGGSLGMALRRERLAQTIVGVGRNAETLEKAVGLGAIDSFATDFAEGVQEADLIVLATPIRQILADIERLAPLLAPGAIVTDVGSTKAEIAQVGATHLPADAFIAGHPMAGSERSGVEAARHDLFLEATWALTPTATTTDDTLNRVRHLAQHVGARTVVLTPEEHDRIVAVTSHLPHVLAYALSAIAGEQAKAAPRLYDLAAGSFASGTRVAASSPELWRDIALTNREALTAMVRAYRSELDEVLTALESDDEAKLLAAFRRGYEAKINVGD